MADDKPDYEDIRKTILKGLTSANLASDINNRLRTSDGKVEKKVEEEKRAYGLEGLLNASLYPEGVAPRFASKAEFERLSVEDQAQKIDEAMSYRQQRHITLSTRKLIADGEDAMRNAAGEYDSKLVEIADSQAILSENKKSKDHELLASYANYAQYKKLAEAAAKGERPEIKEETLRSIVSHGRSRRMYQALKKEGMSDNYAKLGAQFYALAPSEAIKDEEIKLGAESLRDEEEKRLKKLAGGNYKAKIAPLVAKTLTKWLRSKDPGKEQLATDHYFRAYTGKDLLYLKRGEE